MNYLSESVTQASFPIPQLQVAEPTWKILEPPRKEQTKETLSSTAKQQKLFMGCVLSNMESTA